MLRPRLALYKDGSAAEAAVAEDLSGAESEAETATGWPRREANCDALPVVWDVVRAERSGLGATEREMGSRALRTLRSLSNGGGMDDNCCVACAV